MRQISFEKDFLDKLTEQAKESPRFRTHYDLRDSEEDNSMRMLNALEPETVVHIHRHKETSEEVVIIRGTVEEILYDNDGKEISRYRLQAGSDLVACHVPMNQYHSCKSLQSGSVIIEFKNGKYNPKTTEDFL